MSGGLADVFRRLPSLPSVVNGVMNGATEAGQSALASAYSGFTLPRDVYRGDVNLNSDEGLGRVLDTAGLAMSGSMPFKAPRGALRSFGGAAEHADDPLAALEAALAHIKPEAPAAGPRMLDPNAKSWDLYHGATAGEDFPRFDPARAGNPHEKAVFFAPDAETASGYATGTGAGAEAGPRVFRATVEPGKTGVFDLTHLAETDPTFNARAREITVEGSGAAYGPLWDQHMAGFQASRAQDTAIAKQVADLGLPPDPTFGTRISYGHGHIGAAIERAKAQGLDTAILRGLVEHGGDDQVVALTPGRVRSYYDPSHTLYSGGPAGAVPGLAATSSGGGDRGKPVASSNFADALRASAARIGANPLDLATVISYETGGTFNPAIRGGAGNRHIGLIQFGPNEQRAYGANQGQSFADQLPAVERYLTDRGFKRGMGRLDLYSTINAGRPGLYGASDAGNGGAPGTVADKVSGQMGAHERKAAAFLGGTFAPSATAPSAGRTPQAGTDLAAALPGATLPALAGGRGLPPQAGVGAASEPADPLALSSTSSLADAFASLPAADTAARQQRQQAEQQRRQAMLSVNAFGR